MNVVHLMRRCFPGRKKSFKGPMKAFIDAHLNKYDFRPTHKSVKLVAQQTQLQDGSLSALLTQNLLNIGNTQAQTAETLSHVQSMVADDRNRISSLEQTTGNHGQRLGSLEQTTGDLQRTTGDLQERMRALENSSRVQIGDGPPSAPTLIPESPQTQKKVATLIPKACLLYTSPSPRDLSTSRMPSSA